MKALHMWEEEMAAGVPGGVLKPADAGPAASGVVKPSEPREASNVRSILSPAIRPYSPPASGIHQICHDLHAS